MRRVVKVGGSLLLQRTLKESLDRWFSRQPEAENLLIVGGGELIDAVRRLDEVHQLDSIATHWICVELLSTTYDVVCQLAPDWNRIDSATQLRESLDVGFSRDAPTVINISAFYRPTCDASLPTDWRTTTDSIAAHLAMLINADELVLLKSCNVNPTATLSQLIDTEIVDQAMSTIASTIGILRVEKLELAEER